ncbi:tigger transposable element-derived protein 6-like [Aphidius gifuensis]|uniref:tigger transposable element-derived protein 6-like n=1 Tax=Aphidius gifuensis TaxID=684658 RepID=UPI001CDD69CB|nr:tigger transposable element-derived protein 6-like [Aphidius gifuensis]
MGLYKRKTTRQDWHPENMIQAINQVIYHQKSIQETARRYGISRTTLSRRIQQYRFNPDIILASQKGLGSYQPFFTPTQEKELKNHLIEVQGQLRGLGSKQTRVLACLAAQENNIETPWTDSIAGKEWLRGFRARHPDLALRKPESVSIYRARGFNKVVVNKFYDLLEQQQNMNIIIGVGDSVQYPPDRIFNIDETCQSVDPKTQVKILCLKGQRRTGQLTTSDRNKAITVTVCVSASGHLVPPLFIFGRKKMHNKLIANTMEGSWGTVTDKGWMTAASFLQWFKWFIEYTVPTIQRPVLLILDGHASHTKNIEVSRLAAASHVTILCLPPHTTHRLQPLDVSIMKPLSDAYGEISTNMTRSGKRLIEEDIAGMMSMAMEAAATPKNIRAGFRATGICPFNRNVFTRADFAPAYLSERANPATQDQDQDHYQDHYQDQNQEQDQEEEQVSAENQLEKSMKSSRRPMFWSGRPTYHLDDSDEESDRDKDKNEKANSCQKKPALKRMMILII